MTTEPARRPPSRRLPAHGKQQQTAQEGTSQAVR